MNRGATRLVADELVALRPTMVQKRALALGNTARTAALRTRFDLEPKTRRSVDVRPPPDVVPDCARCEDKCCARPENETVLRLLDIARLIDAGHEDAIERGPPQSRTARIKKRADGACTFLDETGQCGIYAHRPLVCRRFPYRIDEPRTAVVWATSCVPTRTGGPGERDALLDAALLSYNEMLLDIVTLSFARDELDALGVGAFLNKDVGL